MRTGIIWAIITRRGPRSLAAMVAVLLAGGGLTLAADPTRSAVARGATAAPSDTRPPNTSSPQPLAMATSQPPATTTTESPGTTATESPGTTAIGSPGTNPMPATGTASPPLPGAPAAGPPGTTTTRPPGTTTTKPPTTNTTKPPTTNTTKPPTTNTTKAPGTPTTTAPPTTTTSVPAGGDGGCNATPTARQATYNILGYLFGDGHWGTDGYSYTARSACKEARMKANIKAAGINATVDGNKFHFPKVAPFDRRQEFGPSPETAAGVATNDDLRWFLTGIIEGEGSGAGKVMDDPNWGRVAGVVDLYRRLGVVVEPHNPPPACNCPTGTGFWNTYVDPSAPTAVYNGYISIIRAFPFADTTRVPKPR